MCFFHFSNAAHCGYRCYPALFTTLYGNSGSSTWHKKMLILLWLLLLIWVIKSFVSDSGVSCLLPVSMKLADLTNLFLANRVNSQSQHSSCHNSVNFDKYRDLSPLQSDHRTFQSPSKVPFWPFTFIILPHLCQPLFFFLSPKFCHLLNFLSTEFYSIYPFVSGSFHSAYAFEIYSCCCIYH